MFIKPADDTKLEGMIIGSGYPATAVKRVLQFWAASIDIYSVPRIWCSVLVITIKKGQ